MLCVEQLVWFGLNASQIKNSPLPPSVFIWIFSSKDRVENDFVWIKNPRNSFLRIDILVYEITIWTKSTEWKKTFKNSQQSQKRVGRDVTSAEIFT